jgi:hypothetical protein
VAAVAARASEVLPGEATLADYLEAVRPALSAALIEPVCVQRMLDIAAGWPPMRAIGFERRLGSDAPAADLAVCFTQRDPAYARLCSPDAPLTPVLRDFLTAASDVASPLCGRVDTFWLEIDTAHGAATPSIFFTPLTTDSRRATIRAAARVLGVRLPPATLDLLSCFDRLPSRLELFQVGLMLGRAGHALRLCLVTVSTRMLQPLAQRLGRPDIVAALDETIAHYGRLVSQIAIGLDVQDGRFGQRFGIELGFGTRWPHVPAERWAELLDGLVERGLCTATERGLLLDWIGRTHEHDAPGLWPDELRGLPVVMAPYEPVLERGLHHVKLVFEQGRPTHAKAYFGLASRWALS